MNLPPAGGLVGKKHIESNGWLSNVGIVLASRALFDGTFEPHAPASSTGEARDGRSTYFYVVSVRDGQYSDRLFTPESTLCSLWFQANPARTYPLTSTPPIPVPIPDLRTTQQCNLFDVPRHHDRDKVDGFVSQMVFRAGFGAGY